jgi:lipopolysaccharide biosynthesis glycosyltransferase
MKLFLATNSLTTKTNNIKMLEVACKSAVQNTDLDVYVIFDGKKEELNLPKEVTIIEHRHRCYDTFLNSKKNIEHDCMAILSGAFLRTEIPFICQQQGFNDEFIFYTDYDVMFNKGDYSDLESVKPMFFAAAPEFTKNDWSYINSGAMIMNIPHFIKQDTFIVDYINNHFETLHVVDQTLYNDLYRGRITRLPLEYNWKTYWGVNEQAKVIHFHGAKPSMVESESRAKVSEIAYLRNLSPAGYNHYDSLFNQFYYS